MIKSMTGFAAVAGEVPGGRFAVELKSVNHRYLEFGPRMPEEWRVMEGPMREALAAGLSRGKVDCRVTFTAVATREALQPNAEALAALADTQKQILGHFEARPLSVWEVMHSPGVMANESAASEDARQGLLALFHQALKELNATREREGAKLGALIEERLARMEEIIKDIAPLVPQMVAQYQEKLKLKIDEAMAGAASDDRLKQEVVLFASKIDVAEELGRLHAHVGEVRRVLKQGGAAGKRLDFLMQELNRESNTLGSKSVAVDSTKASIELKVLIEQMREQVQNIE
ncbi:MAG: YicC family protein [Betaproteobacteria bacterium]|nr:YicC family protein [Betaproteobacteria bacterium]